MIPPAGDHSVYITVLRNFGPLFVMIIDLIVIFARFQHSRSHKFVQGILITATMLILLFTAALWMTPFWLHTIPNAIAKSARLSAKYRPYCIELARMPVRTLNDLDMKHLDEAFEYGIEIYSYYVVLKIKDELFDWNWTFRAAKFIPAQTEYERNHPKTHCTPVFDGNLG